MPRFAPVMRIVRGEDIVDGGEDGEDWMGKVLEWLVW